jgi:uncharacterized phage infection (PIP) family protein YhgE
VSSREEGETKEAVVSDDPAAVAATERNETEAGDEKGLLTTTKETAQEVTTEFPSVLGNVLSDTEDEIMSNNLPSVDGSDKDADGSEESAEGSDESPEGSEESADGSEESADGSDESADGSEESAEGSDESADGSEESAEGSEESAEVTFQNEEELSSNFLPTEKVKSETMSANISETNPVAAEPLEPPPSSTDETMRVDSSQEEEAHHHSTLSTTEDSGIDEKQSTPAPANQIEGVQGKDAKCYGQLQNQK